MGNLRAKAYRTDDVDSSGDIGSILRIRLILENAANFVWKMLDQAGILKEMANGDRAAIGASRRPNAASSFPITETSREVSFCSGGRLHCGRGREPNRG